MVTADELKRNRSNPKGPCVVVGQDDPDWKQYVELSKTGGLQAPTVLVSKVVKRGPKDILPSDIPDIVHGPPPTSIEPGAGIYIWRYYGAGPIDAADFFPYESDHRGRNFKTHLSVDAFKESFNSDRCTDRIHELIEKMREPQRQQSTEPSPDRI